METTQTKTAEMSSVQATDFVYEAIRGAGMVGGYIQNILTDTMYCAEKYVAYVRDVYSDLRGTFSGGRGKDGGMTIMNIMRSGAEIGDAERKEFYMNFGRDMVDITKTGLESENLTIIELSKYKM